MEKELTEICKLHHHRKLFVGIGNVLKKDDGIGVYISRNIRNEEHIIALTAEVSIENYIGKINSINADILVIIDCVDMQLNPGAFKLLRSDEILDFTFNTHNISLKKLADFFQIPTCILGIQPLDIGFGEEISSPVMKTAKKIIKLINNKEVNHGNTVLMPDLQGSVKS